MRRALLILFACSLACVGCKSNKDTFDSALLEVEDVCLKVNGKDMFIYDPLTCQLASSPEATSFRAFTDDVSDYFILTLGAAPSEEKQKIQGCRCCWTTDTDVVEKEGLTFQVRKIDAGGFVWLWCSSAKIFAVVRIL